MKINIDKVMKKSITIDLIGTSRLKWRIIVSNILIKMLLKVSLVRQVNVSHG